MSPRYAAILLLLSGCLGTFKPEGPGDKPGGPAPAAPQPPTIVDGPGGAKVGPRDVRRLSVREYDNTVRDAFALGDAWPGSGLPPDRASKIGFDNDTTLLAVDDARAADLEAAAERVAEQIMQKGFAALGACGTLGRPCAEAVLDRHAPKLFRRALAPAERDRYLGAFDQMVTQGAAPDEALRWTLTALLSSPYFLYRFELGEPDGNGGYQLTGEELAVALAYDFTASPPSDELLARGRAGELADPAVRAQVARELLDSPRGKAQLEHFAARWLRYEEVRTIAKDEQVVANFAALRNDMAEETRRFVEHVFYEKKGGVADLFTSDQTFVSAALAQHYALPPPAAPFAAVTRPAEQALGLLAQGAILSRFSLTDGTSPPQRGAFIRRQFLCEDLPPPPPNVGEPPHPTPGVTTRERYEQVTAPKACAGCHRIINGAGFALENFDTAGRWRTSELGKVIDASGILADFGQQGDVAFMDAKGAAALLAHSADVARCVGGQMAAYTFGMAEGRVLAAPADAAALASGGSLHDFFAKLAAAPHFALRIEK